MSGSWPRAIYAANTRMGAASTSAPHIVVIEPGHDAWVVGDESAVLIQFDFASDTLATLGLPSQHQHD